MTTNQWIVTCVQYGDATNRTGFNTEEEANDFAESMNEYVRREGTSDYIEYTVSPKEEPDMETVRADIEASTWSLDDEEPTTMFTCLTCTRETMGTHCIMCMEANSCVKHKEERDPIAGCMSCFREYQEENPTQGGITMKTKSITTCPDCQKMITEGTHYCKECYTIRHEDHMAKMRIEAYEHLEKMGDKATAIEKLCAYANANCMAMYDTWLYQYGVEMYGITRADYYNDYDALTEEDKMYIGDNWKPNTENQLENLKADLERATKENKARLASIEQDLQNGITYNFKFYEYEFKMLGELVGAVSALSPRSGRYQWELQDESPTHRNRAKRE